MSLTAPATFAGLQRKNKTVEVQRVEIEPSWFIRKVEPRSRTEKTVMKYNGTNLIPWFVKTSQLNQ